MKHHHIFLGVFLLFVVACNAAVTVTGSGSSELVITSTVGSQDCQLRMQRGGDWTEILKVCHLSGSEILEWKIRVMEVIEFVDSAGNGYQRTDSIVQNLGFTQSFSTWAMYATNKYSMSSTITGINGTVDFGVSTLTHAADAYWTKFNYQSARQNSGSKLAIKTELVSIRKLSGNNVQASGTIADILNQFGNPFGIAYDTNGNPVTITLSDTQQTSSTPDIKHFAWFTINHTANLNFNGIPYMKLPTPNVQTTGEVTSSPLTSGAVTSSPLTSGAVTSAPLTTGFDCADPTFLNQLQYCGYV